ncbi:AAA family ATPase [Cupriavidus sp. 30B13]|uniref:AAA family ATPase n=1 Tax=Cupriavidus sp. 30B13 TaxID=3384241 RepID=UPI003B920AFE
MKRQKTIHFSLLTDVCRAAISDNESSRSLVSRLSEIVAERGDPDGGAIIRALLAESNATAPGDTEAAAPNTLEKDAISIALPGENLTRASRIPVDRETAAPLASVLYRDHLPSAPPILASELHATLESFVAEWQRSAELLQVGIQPARSCLFFGEPGTGKTQLALWLASRLGLPVILARLDGLMSSFLGTTSRNIGNLFAFANRHRAVLLLDEVDAIAKLRDDPNEVGEIKRVVNTLLQNIDERAAHGLTFSITNHPQLLDPAVWRRFEIQMELPKPGTVERMSIIRKYAMPLEFAAGELKLITWLLQGTSGAEVEDFVRSIRKSWVLQGATIALVERLRMIAYTHAARISKVNLAEISKPDREIAGLLANCYNFSVPELAQAFSVNRTTIARWLN